MLNDKDKTNVCSLSSMGLTTIIIDLGKEIQSFYDLGDKEDVRIITEEINDLKEKYSSVRDFCKGFSSEKGRFVEGMIKLQEESINHINKHWKQIIKNLNI